VRSFAVRAVNAARSFIAQNAFCRGTRHLNHKVGAEELSAVRRAGSSRDFVDDFARMSQHWQASCRK